MTVGCNSRHFDASKHCPLFNIPFEHFTLVIYANLTLNENMKYIKSSTYITIYYCHYSLVNEFRSAFIWKPCIRALVIGI